MCNTRQNQQNSPQITAISEDFEQKTKRQKILAYRQDNRYILSLHSFFKKKYKKLGYMNKATNFAYAVSAKHDLQRKTTYNNGATYCSGNKTKESLWEERLNSVWYIVTCTSHRENSSLWQNSLSE